jgi:uncharacterized protein (DUF924 family)
MVAAPRPWAAELLHFWFHELRPDQWFARSDAIDDELRRRFARELASLGNRPAREFLRDRLTARAAVLLFDQLPRNLFRDSPRAFACDPLARAVARGILARGWDRGLAKAPRQFIYMPLMHSEAIADQRRCLRRFAELDDSFAFGFARAHYRMVARFGRFPHRNRVLGRKSTPAERQAVAAGNAW